MEKLFPQVYFAKRDGIESLRKQEAYGQSLSAYEAMLWKPEKSSTCIISPAEV